MRSSPKDPKDHVSVTEIDYIPEKVEVSDLDAENKLKDVSQDVIDQAVRKQGNIVGPNDHAMKKVRKEMIQSPRRLPLIGAIILNRKAKYSVVQVNGESYRLYYGAKKEKHLGKGGFGKARLAQRVSDGRWFAYKSVMDNSENVNREFAALQNLRMGLGVQSNYESRQAKKNQKGEVKKERQLLLMELAPGQSLWDFSERRPPPHAVKLVEAGLGALDALEAIHKEGWLHRDIKGGNIVFDPTTGKVQIIDAGLMKKIDPNATPKGIIKDARMGTPDFMSPEIMSKGHYSTQSDVYAMGMTLGFLFNFEQLPVPGSRDNKFSPLNQGAHELIPYLDLRQRLAEVVNQMIHPDPAMRIELGAAREEVKAILSELGARSKKKVAIVDVADYKKNPKYYHRELKAYDEVILVGSKSVDKNELARLKHKLAHEGIDCKNKFYQGKDAKALLDKIRRENPHAAFEDMKARRKNRGEEVVLSKGKLEIMIAEQYETGRDKDLPMAYRLYVEAQEKGAPNLENKIRMLDQKISGYLQELERIISHGKEGYRNLPYEIKFCEQLMDLGIKEGKLHLAVCLLEGGPGFEPRPTTAYIHLLELARINYGPAIWKLAVMREKGDGIPQNLNEAKKWYQQAEKNGDKSARKDIARVENEIAKQEQAMLEQAKQEQVKLEQAKPEQAKPEQAKPEQAKPEQTKPSIQIESSLDARAECRPGYVDRAKPMAMLIDIKSLENVARNAGYGVRLFDRSNDPSLPVMALLGRAGEEIKIYANRITANVASAEVYKIMLECLKDIYKNEPKMIPHLMAGSDAVKPLWKQACLDAGFKEENTLVSKPRPLPSLPSSKAEVEAKNDPLPRPTRNGGRV